MKKTFMVLFTVFSIMSVAAGISRADGEEAVIKDEAGNVLMSGVSETDIPKLVEYYIGGGMAGESAGNLLEGYGPKAVPKLLDALGKRHGTGAVLIMLRKIKDPRAIVPISRFINSPDPGEADIAKGGMAEFGDAAVPTLAGLMKDRAYLDAAAGALQVIPTPSEESRDIIRALLASKDKSERAGAWLVLGAWKDGVLASQIEKTMATDVDMVRVYAIKGYYSAFTQEPEKYDSKLMTMLLKDKNNSVKTVAADILYAKPDPEALEQLISMIKDEKDPDVRQAAAGALASIKDDRVVLPLIGLISNPAESNGMKESALRGLGNMKAEEAVSYITKMAEKGISDDILQVRTFECLLEIGAPVDMGVFLPYLNKISDHETMAVFLDFLGRFSAHNDEKVIKALLEFRDNGQSIAEQWRVDDVITRLR